MLFSHDVDIRFSVSKIKSFLFSVDYAENEMQTAYNEVDSAFRQGEELLNKRLEYIKKCQEVNATDSENAQNFKQWLEHAIFKKEKELETCEKEVNRTYKAKNDAYNNYDSVKSKANSKDPNSGKAVDDAYKAYKDAEDAYKNACDERDKCKRHLEALKQAQTDLFWTMDKIHDDRMMLDDKERETQAMISRLNGAYSNFVGVYNTASRNMDDARSCTQSALKSANYATDLVSDLVGYSVGEDNETSVTSIAEVYEAGDKMELLNERLREDEKEMKYAVAQYNELVIDNIMASVEEQMEDIQRKIAKEIKQNERKADTMKAFAKALQSYYNSI